MHYPIVVLFGRNSEANEAVNLASSNLQLLQGLSKASWVMALA